MSEMASCTIPSPFTIFKLRNSCKCSICVIHVCMIHCILFICAQYFISIHLSAYFTILEKSIYFISDKSIYFICDFDQNIKENTKIIYLVNSLRYQVCVHTSWDVGPYLIYWMLFDAISYEFYFQIAIEIVLSRKSCFNSYHCLHLLLIIR